MPIVLGIAILTVLLSSNIMKPEYCSPRPRTSTMEMFAFLDYYGYYAIPFELVLPILLWAVSEIRSRKSGKTCAPGDPGDAGRCARQGD